MTVRELVGALGVTTTAVRLQVDRLVGDGILTVEKRGGRRGRPSDVFRLSDRARGLVSHQYDKLIDYMLAELTDRDGPDKVRDLLSRVAARMADGYAKRLSGDTVKDKLSMLVGVLHEQDIPAEVSEEGDRLILRQCGCPYFKLARTNRAICGVHIRVLNRLAGEQVRRVRCLAHGDTRCEFEVKSNGHADRRAAEPKSPNNPTSAARDNGKEHET
jgi:predicted ArsR family transcriptional regulator